ncbi:ATP-binding cassette domain-containing protein [Photobacterium indicum]|uniref:ATP-binding cassette domain-containing protein n=1 Tax=Photobacterium indicum TaxID=81447 RepID=UPI003D14489C
MSSIIVKNLVLDYPIRNKLNPNKYGESSVGGRIFEKKGSLYLRAIDGISLDINSGDRVGIIGHNGAGKSTLLKTLAGIYKPTSGSISINGTIAPLFNLKFGMDMELSGYDNILLRALYLGVPKKEIIRKRDGIAELSGLGDFLFLPMKTYSSGMIARLAFSVSTKIDADILLLDEMIGTGDAQFINKTSEMAKGFVASSNILLLASHSNKVIREICNKAIVFEHGKIVDFSDVDSALRTYKKTTTINTKINNSYRGNVKRQSNELLKKGGGKKYLLLNDTSISDNIGCQAVKESLAILLRKKSTCIDSVPLGYGQDLFKDIASKSSEWIDKQNGFPKYKDVTSKLDYNMWVDAKEKLRKQDEFLKKVDDYDFIVVNAEGSIHHNSARALTLLAQIALFSEVKPVVVLNCSIFNIDETVLKESLSKVELIHSREGFTHRYLKQNDIDSFYAPDIASLYINSLKYNENLIIKGKSKLCLVSLGVLATPKNINNVIECVKSKGLTPVYLSMSDGDEDRISSDICKSLDIKHYVASEIDIENSLYFFGQFEVIISGRHHLNIFSLRVNSKLICLPSNTLKVEGTLGFISKDRPIAYDMEDLDFLLEKERYPLPLTSVRSFSKQIENTVLEPLNEFIDSI